MLERHLAFIDESGNAGDYLLDDQSIFCIVGIVVRESRVQQLSELFRQLKFDYGFSPDQEVKGARLIRNRNSTLVKKACELVLTEGLPVVATVVERRFMICALIVQDFFDPVYNPFVNDAWTFDLEIQRELADHFYDHLSEGTIALAGRALVRGDTADLEELQVRVRSDLSMHPRLKGLDIVGTLSGLDDFVQELGNAIRESREPQGLPLRLGRGVARSPNVVAYLDIINTLESIYGRGDTVVDLVFDSSRQFNQSFSDWLNVRKDAPPVSVVFPGRTPLIIGFRSLATFSATDSRDAPLLQCADCFAAGIRHVFELCSRQIDPIELNEAMTFFYGLAFIMWNEGLLNPVASGTLLKRFYAKCVELAA